MVYSTHIHTLIHTYMLHAYVFHEYSDFHLAAVCRTENRLESEMPYSSTAASSVEILKFCHSMRKKQLSASAGTKMIGISAKF